MNLSKKIAILFLIVFQYQAFAQKNDNPILFTEINFGSVTGVYEGLQFGTSLDYQFKDNLITAKISFLLNIPYNESLSSLRYNTFDNINEYGVLYGKRHTYIYHSLSYSAGISYLQREFNTVNNTTTTTIFGDENYFGFPLEVSVKFFKPKKSRVSIYYLLPIGQKTSFGGSMGFKLFGNISKRSFVGIGKTFGFGWHKYY